MEFRGAAAVIFVAVIGVITIAIAASAYWWVSRNPEVSARLGPANQRRFWWSLALALAAVTFLLLYAVLWWPSN